MRHRGLLLVSFVFAMMCSVAVVSVCDGSDADTVTGACGDDLTYSINILDEELIIDGTGRMYSYELYEAPWHQYSNVLTKLTINEGITIIGSNAFYGCTFFTGELILPDGLQYIESNAFYGCTGFSGSLTIPGTVKIIYASAFSGCTGFSGSLTISDGVEEIHNSVFRGCTGFTGTLNLPHNLCAIKENAFSHCSGFSGSLSVCGYIGEYAFSNCTGFDGTLTIRKGTNIISEYAFRNCSGFSGSLFIPDTVSTIDNRAFYGCTGFTGTLMISGKVSLIGDYAFSFNSGLSSFTSLAIDYGVSGISESAFAGWGFYNKSGGMITGMPDIVGHRFSGPTSNMVLQSAIDEYLITYDVRDGSEPAPKQKVVSEGFTFTVDDYSGVRSGYIFKGWSDCSSIYLPGDEYVMGDSDVVLTAIWVGTDMKCGDDLYYCIDSDTKTLIITGTGSMYDYKIKGAPWYDSRNQLTSLILSEGITSIGSYAFEGCSKFSGPLVIPSSVTSIGHHAFARCSGFTGTLTIPVGVTAIADSTFTECRSIQCLDIHSGVESIGYCAFYGCFGLTGSFEIPSGVVSLGDYAFENCYYFSGTLTIPSGVTSIGKSAFASTCFTSIDVDESNPAYTSVDGILFSKDKKTLIQATIGNEKHDYVIPSKVVSIGPSAFRGCMNLTGILTIPSSVKSIGYSAFNACSGLTGTLSIPLGVGSIGDYAFLGCKGLTCIDIPSSVSSIGEFAFDSCSSVVSLSMNGPVPTIGIHAFCLGTSIKEVKCTVLGFEEGYLDLTYYRGDYTEFTYLHRVTYDTYGGSGDPPVQEPLAMGAEFILASYSGKMEGCRFSGWDDGSMLCSPGGIYVMGPNDILLTAIWLEPEPLVLSCSDSEIDRAGEASVTVSVTENPGISLFRIAIGYDEVLLLSDTVFSGMMECVGCSEGENSIEMSFEASGDAMFGTGDLVTLIFSVAGTVESGMHYVRFTDSEALSYDLIRNQVSPSDGSVNVIRTPGDLDWNGTIDSSDSLLMRKHLANWDVTVYGDADMDGDGKITLKDSLLLRTLIAGQKTR